MMLKIGVIGITAVFLALLIKKEKSELALLVAVAAATLIFGYVLTRIHGIIEFLGVLAEYLPVEKSFFTALLKMLGITYLADFAASICKEAGYGSIAGQLELFAKISIMALSIPELTSLVRLIEKLLQGGGS